MKIPSWTLIACYLASAIVANMLAWRFGQLALVWTAAMLIPFDFLARDVLHRRWELEGAVRARMLCLVVLGSVVTWILNPAAGSVALASGMAFATSSSIDALLFALVRGSLFKRAMLSNVIGSITDSIVFPAVAFGVVDFCLSASQVVLKLVGGLVWLYIWECFYHES